MMKNVINLPLRDATGDPQGTPVAFLAQAGQLLEDYVYATAGDGEVALQAHLILVAADLQRLAARLSRKIA